MGITESRRTYILNNILLNYYYTFKEQYFEKVIWLTNSMMYRFKIPGIFLAKMSQRPISHSFTYKNQDFDGPFYILMGLFEKK